MSDDEQAIRKVVGTWMDATRRGDVETVLDLMTSCS
jgi:ketosteroid isomerase-like protein